MLEKIKVILGRILPHIDTSPITESTRLTEDLQFDSINMMMLLTELEEEYGFCFNHFIGFETVGDICGYLECRV